MQTHNNHSIPIMKILLSANGLRSYIIHIIHLKLKYSFKNPMPVYSISYTYFLHIKQICLFF